MNDKQINVGINFNVNKQNLNALQQSLNEVIVKAKETEKALPDYAEPFQEAAAAARDLQLLLNSSWNSKIGQLDLGKVEKGLINLYGSTKDFKQVLSQIGPEGQKVFNQFTQAVLSTQMPIKQTNAMLDRMAVTFKNTVRYGISSSIWNNFSNSVSKAYGYVKDLDRSLNDIRIVSGQSADEMARLARQANKTAQALGNSTLDYTKAALIYYQQGLSGDEVSERTEVTLKMANVLRASASEVSDYMTAVWNNFADGTETLEHYADVITALGAATAASSEEIATGLEKFAAIGKTVGLSYEYATSALATVVAQTRQSADTVGTAFKTLFARIQDLELGKSLDDGTTLGKYAEALNKVGINIKDSSGELKKMDKILEEMGSKWKELSKDEQVALAQNVAGTRQYTQLVALMDNWDKFQMNLGTANDAEGTLQKQQEIYLQSLDAHMEKMGAAWESLYQNIFDEDVMKIFVDGFTKLINLANTFVTGLGGGLNSIIYIAMTLGNVFSSQISDNIVRMEKNAEKAKAALEDVAVAKRLLEDVNASGSLYQINREGVDKYKEEYEINSKILDIKSTLSEKDQETLAINDQIIADLKEENEVLEKIKNHRDPDTGNYEGAATDKKAQQKELREKYKSEGLSKAEWQKRDFEERVKTNTDKRAHNDIIFEKMSNNEALSREDRRYLGKTSGYLGGRIEQDEKRIKKLSAEGLDPKQIEAFKKQNEELKKQKKYIDEARKSGKAYQEVFDPSYIQKGIQTQNEHLEHNIKIDKKAVEILGDKKKISSQEVELKQAENNEIIAGINEQKKGLVVDQERRQEMQQFVSGLFTIGSTISAISGSIKTLFNPDLSTWEKITSIFSVLATQSLILVGNWDKVAAVGPKIAEWAAKRVALMEVENAKQKENIALTKVENAEEATQVALEQAETAEDAAQSGFTLKETLLNIVKIVQQGIINALKAVEALLSGNITALGVAAAAALVAGAVALGTWVVNMIKANSEESKLKKKVEETTEAAEKAKEAFNEINETFKDYTDAKKSIEELEEGTIEFYEAIQKANEAAEKLIDQLGLIAGVDYGIDSNGLININEDSLNTKMFQEQQKVFRAQADKYQAQLDLEKYNQKQTVEKFRNEIAVGPFGTYSMSTSAANKILRNPTNDNIREGSGTMELTTLGKILNVGQSILTFTQPALALENKVLENGFTTVASTVEKGDKDITQAIGKYSAAYQQSDAKQQSLNNLLSANYILGYGSQSEVSKYNALSDRLKKQVNDRVTAEREAAKKEGTSEENKAKDKKWYNYVGDVLDVVAVTALTGGLGTAPVVASKVSQEVKNETDKTKAKEDYMRYVYKYKQDKAGNWYDPRTGYAIDYDKTIKEIDTKEAVSRYNSGEYSTQEILEKNLTKIKGIQDKASAAGFNKTSQSYIAEAMMGSTESVGLMTKEEFQYYLNEKYGTLDKDLTDIINDESKNLIQKVGEGFANIVGNLPEYAEIMYWKMNGQGNNQLRLIEDAKAYREELEAQAEALGTTAEALDFYSLAMDNAAGVTHKQTRETAEAAAAEYKFNKAYNESRKVYEDNKDLIKAYGKAIENNEKVSYDLADAMGELSKSLKAMGLSLSGETITKNLKLIDKLLNGTVEDAKEAYAELYKLSRLDTLKQFFGDPSTLENGDAILKKYNEIVEAIDATEPGKNMAQKYADQLQDMITKTQMTADQIATLADQLGIEIPVEIDAPDDFTVEDAEFTTKAQSVTHRYDGEMPNPAYNGKNSPTIQVHYAWVETTEEKKDHFLVPKGTNFKVNKNSQNLSQGTNFSIAPSNKKSGGNDKPDTMDPVEAEIDRYHQVNTQITKVDNALKKLQTQQNKLVGNKWLDNLNAQWNQLNIQIDNYNEKLRIAELEQQELAGQLSGKGVQFNADGTIANYTQVIEQQEAYVNGLINNYNRMTKEQQEKYKETVENAKEEFDKFQENLDRYDELVSDFMPDLRQNIQDALDEQIELNIEKFNKEIEITLDLDQATRDWNEWAKRAIQGFDAEDIFGSAQARLKDFYTYFNENETADAQVDTKHVNDILEEFRKMNAGEDSIYGSTKAGYNRAQAIDDLKEHYTQLMQSITDVIELQDELHQDWLDKMDEVQEKFDEQISSYEFLRDIINHDIKLLQLSMGEDAYGEMKKFYEAQQDNYEKQLDFQRQQRDFWYEQMMAAEEGTKEWESARDKWKEAVNEFNSILEEGLENAKAKFENAINDIFKKLNESLTKGMGLEFVNTQWDLINQNADRYLDTINATYAIRELEKKYVDSINKSDNVAVQQRLKKVMDEQLENMKERDRITQYDVDRANKLYEIEMARIALQEAQQNKSQMRLRRDSQGNYTYQYVADNDAISAAEDQLSNLYNDLYNFDKERYNQVLNDIYEIWDAYQQAMAEAALINDPELRAEKERLIQEQYNELMMQAAEDYQVAKYDLEESFFWDWVDLNDMTLDNFKNLTDNEKDIIMTEFVPTWKNGISEMADIFSGPGGFAEVTQESWEDIKEAENEYADDMKELEIISGQTFDEIISGEDESIQKAQALIQENKTLIDAYGLELDAVKKCYDAVRDLRDMYHEAEQAAIQAAEAAQRLWEIEMRRQQEELALQKQINAEKSKAAQQQTPSGSSNKKATSSGGGSGSGGSGMEAGSGGGKNDKKSGSGGSSAMYAITLDYDNGKSAEVKNVYAGESITLPSSATKSGYKFTGWDIPSLGLCTMGGYTYKPTRSEVVKAMWIKVASTATNSSYSFPASVKGTQLKKFDTGGYTGTWNDDGKLALLHQKELVLNQQDTENMLNAVAIMRTMAYQLGSSVLAKLAGASASGINGGDSARGALEQNVHIDAQFPNVRNAAEIEEALNNLVNAASQRIHENR